MEEYEKESPHDREEKEVRREQFLGWIFIIAFFAIIVLLSGIGIVDSLENVASTKQAESGLPLRLKIPRINVDAVIEYVGLTKGGAMDAPKEPTDVGWFSLGTRPGDIGSSVISGHFGWKDGVRAVFDSLNALRKGDKIYVEDDAGITSVFVVRDIKTYDSGADASLIFGSDDGKAHLNLITCEGAWNKTAKSYSDRLVVFADKETPL